MPTNEQPANEVAGGGGDEFSGWGHPARWCELLLTPLQFPQQLADDAHVVAVPLLHWLGKFGVAFCEAAMAFGGFVLALAERCNASDGIGKLADMR